MVFPLKTSKDHGFSILLGGVSHGIPHVRTMEVPKKSMDRPKRRCLDDNHGVNDGQLEQLVPSVLAIFSCLEILMITPEHV